MTGMLAPIEHIVVDEEGIPWIAGANTKVLEVVLDSLAYGWAPAEIHSQHPHLSLSQIYAALAYYHDNKEPIDRQIATDLAELDRLRADAAESPFVKRMRSEGRLV